MNVSDEEIVYFCMPPSALRLGALDFWVLTNMFICLLVVVIYTAAWRQSAGGSVLLGTASAKRPQIYPSYNFV